MDNENYVPTSQDIIDFTHLSQGYINTHLLLVSAKLGLSRHLATGSKSAAELAQLTDSHQGTLERFLRALVQLRIIEINEQQEYEKGPILPLVDGILSPSFDDTSLRSWTHVMHTLKTGEPGWDQAYGCSFYQQLDRQPQQSRAFDQWNANSVLYLDPLLALYDFNQFDTIADIGGGWGGFLTKVLQSAPNSKGILFDRPEVIVNTIENLKDNPTAERITPVGGSFFEQVPQGGDCYTLCRVLLNWNESQVVEILSNCKKVMKEGTKLLILDFCIPEPDHPSYKVLVNNDLNLLVNLGGASRTTEQWQELVTQAGLKVQNLHMAPSALLFLLEATI